MILCFTFDYATIKLIHYQNIGGNTMSIIDHEYSIKSMHLVASSIHSKKKITSNLKGRHSDCFAYIIEGCADFVFTDNTSIRVNKDDVLFLAKGSKYVFNIISESYTAIFVDFDFDTHITNKSQNFTPKNPIELKNIFYSIKRKWITKKSAYYLDCLSSLYKIYALIIQNELFPYIPKSKQSTLNNAIKKIADDFSNPDLSINELATISGMSEGHFRRVFKNVYSVSPMQYIKNIRINYAKNLLILKEYSISEIAQLSGFTNSFYFCKRFKTETDMTPSEYRNTHTESSFS